MHSDILNIDQTQETLDFRRGDIYGTSNPTKVAYSGTYTIVGSNYSLSSAREYVGIMESGDKVYFKFCDDDIYRGSVRNT